MGIIVSILMFNIFSGYSQRKDSASSDKLVAPWWNVKFKLTAGYFLSINNAKIQVGANRVIEGTNIDLEKDLGFGTTFSTFLTNFQWRITRRRILSVKN